MSRFRSIAGLLMLVSLLALGPARAQDSDGFASYVQVLRARAAAAGVSDRTIDTVTASLSFNPKVVALDRDQPESNPNAPIPKFTPYRVRHVDGERIAEGRAKLAELAGSLRRIEAETGVPGAILVSIYGNETDFGRFTGHFDIPDALASLAYDGRRRALFESEFVDALKMIDRGVPRDRLTGSWAGAMGKPQFLPSVYLRLARASGGGGYADIWNSEPDALASIATYFRAAGWRPGQPWGFAVTVPAGFDRAEMASRLHSDRCPRVFARHSRWLTLAEWRARGVIPRDGAWPSDDTILAQLIEPDGVGAPGYLLTSNYNVILDYNCSNFYALSVGLLADAIER